MANLNNVIGFTAERLNERVTVLRQEAHTDNEGNRIREYRDYKTVWASVEVLGSLNSGEADSEVKRVINYSVVIRYQHDIIQELDRLRWNGVVLRQTSPAVVIGKKYIVISCKDLRENG